MLEFLPSAGFLDFWLTTDHATRYPGAVVSSRSNGILGMQFFRAGIPYHRGEG